ncbi:MAG: bifunctional methylenetetrahydrofolate dehydrogenase/methenyltetrahydrofolate cyclohydrolase [Rickettsiales bacterium]|nr:bifunctional methylenetetrahydrofolate dehydrogenase/methenyltetrahydrofolate cyclohydrolase [Rickettsiales bacterium]
MTAQIINGKEIATKIKQNIAKEVEKLKKQHGITPTLAVILVGNDPASEVYVGNKEKAAHLVGMNSIQFKMAADISEEDLIAKITELNNDNNIHGILVQLPLPKHIDTTNVIKTINDKKDVDGFNVVNVGKLATGQLSGDEKALVPCTPLGCIDLLKTVVGDDLAGMKVLVIGNSNIVGRPLAQLLMYERATITIANSATKNLKNECLSNDVIISATGVANLVKEDMVTKDSIIIDVGINRVDAGNGKTKLVGDVDFENVKDIVKAITPVPGGVGPMTITYLLKNTLTCYLKLIK